MKNNGNSKKIWFVISLFLVIAFVAVAIFFYHNFFRQNNALLIETVPLESSFILQINNNDDFVKTSSQLLPYLNELLYTSALPGFEFFIDQLTLKKPTVMLSGYSNGDHAYLLLSVSITESSFSNLLKTLQIDQRNYIPFDKSKIYSYGTHLKKFSFSFNNNVLSISEDVELLKKSIVQHKHPRNLLSDKLFSQLYQIASKNEKQNWLFLHNKYFFELKKEFFSGTHQHLVAALSEIPSWSIFHIRFTDKELLLSGYMRAEYPFFQNLHTEATEQSSPATVVPFLSPFYTVLKQPVSSSSFIKKSEDSTRSIPTFEANELLHFQLYRDTLSYHFIAMKTDSGKREALISIDSTQNVELTTQKGEKIYRSSLSDVHIYSAISNQNIELNYFTVYQGYYVFSDTTTSLDYYLQQISQQNFTRQPYYSFAKSNLPSISSYEFCMIIPEKGASSITPFFNKELHNNTTRNLQVFAFSLASRQKDLVPINVYVKFR